MESSFASTKWGRMVAAFLSLAKPTKMNTKYNNNIACVGQAHEQLK